MTEPFGPFVTGRGARIAFQVRERASSSWSNKDISASRWAYRIRSYVAAGSSPTVNEALTKGAAASTGWIDHYLSLGATERAAMVWELVEVDTSNADATTPSTYREVVLLRWTQAVISPDDQR